MNRRLKGWIAALGLLAVTGAAQAALIDRGGGMIYDSTRNLTWLADMNHAFTSGYSMANEGGTGADKVFSSGRMGWNAAKTWADNLIFGGFDDWRLPSLNPSDSTCGTAEGSPPVYSGFGCTGGELSGLFVTEFGNKGGESVLNAAGDTAQQIANLGLFSNVQARFYWSGTAVAGIPGAAWAFYSDFGSVNAGATDMGFFATAVRQGDVAAPVPVPQTLALVLVAMGAAMLARRRKRA